MPWEWCSKTFSVKKNRLLFVLMLDLVLEAHGINNYHKPVNHGSKDFTFSSQKIEC